MINESEPFTGTNIRSHLRALQAQIDLMKGSLNEYGELSRKLKKQITEEFVAAVIARFEKNELKIKNLDENIVAIDFDTNERLSQEVKSIKNEMAVVYKNEEMIRNLEEKMNSLQFDIREKIPQEIRSIRDEISDAQLSRAITSISEEKEIKVSSKPLSELEKDRDLKQTF